MTLETSLPLATVRLRPPSPRLQLALLLCAHVALWTWVGVSSRSNFDAPGDMVETYVWAQGWQWGYFKHPPLAAWVVGLWFKVVPESQWGFSLLSACNSALGLLGLALLAREFLPGRWVLLAVGIGSLAPGVTALGMRYNCNAVLIATWPWAMAMTARLLRTGRNGDAAGCGLAWALAMLGKYFSGVLLLSVLAAALMHPPWRARLRSRQVALATLVCLALLAPHLVWLLGRTQGPLQYAAAAAVHETRQVAAVGALKFGASLAAFPLLALLVLQRSLVGQRARAAIGQAASALLRPRRDLVWLLAALPIATTMAVTVSTGARTATVWGLGMTAGLALLVTCRLREAGARLDLRALWGTLAAVWVIVAALSPLWWLTLAGREAPSVTEPRAELAERAQGLWRTEVGTPLVWVSGQAALAASVSFYAPDHPRYWSLGNPAVETPWVSEADLREHGGIIVCSLNDATCEAGARRWSSERHEVDAAKEAKGFRFESRPYALYLLRPPSKGPGRPN